MKFSCAFALFALHANLALATGAELDTELNGVIASSSTEIVFDRSSGMPGLDARNDRGDLLYHYRANSIPLPHDMAYLSGIVYPASVGSSWITLTTVDTTLESMPHPQGCFVRGSLGDALRFTLRNRQRVDIQPTSGGVASSVMVTAYYADTGIPIIGARRACVETDFRCSVPACDTRGLEGHSPDKVEVEILDRRSIRLNWLSDTAVSPRPTATPNWEHSLKSG